MKRTYPIFIKAITVLIITSLVVSWSYLIEPPKKAEAGVADCLAYFGIGTTQSAAEEAKKTATNIPVTLNEYSTGGIKTGAVYGTFFQACIMQGLVLPLAKIMIAKITDSIVTWINSGFEGNPSFITDPEQFFLDSADQLAGDYILGTDLAFLCSPFKINIKIALAINYSNQSTTGGATACTLSKVIGNVENFYNNFQEGGWPGWFEMTQNPANNMYGAYINANQEISLKINNNEALELSKLNWGGGFLSWTQCYRKDGTSYTQYGPSGGGTVAGKKVNINAKENPTDRCEIKTPGNVIGASINKSLGVEQDQLGLVDSFDKLFNALGNQIFMRTIAGAQGLLGSSGHGQGGNGGNTRPFDNLDPKYYDNYKALADGASNTTFNNVNNSINQPVEGENEIINPEENIARKGDIGAFPERSGGVQFSKLTDGDLINQSMGGMGEDATYDGAKTGKDLNPYLQVSYTRDYTFGRIRVIQRGDRPAIEPSNISFKIDVLDKTGAVVYSSEPVEQNYSSIPKIFYLPAVKGRVVRIQGIGNGSLHIAELEVYQYEKPKVTLKADSEGRTTYTTMFVGTQFIDPGATATDNQGEDISANIVVKGIESINSSVPGTYNIQYVATDRNNVSATSTRQVQVQQQ